MPKIRQAIAVLIAAAFCIGFNTLRYPAVWDMVAAAPQASRPAGTGDAADLAAAKDGDGSSPSELNAARGVCARAPPERFASYSQLLALDTCS